MSGRHVAARALALILSLAIVVTGCTTTSVQPHEAKNEKPAVHVKALWADAGGKKYLVAGIEYQLRRIEGQERKTIATAVSTTEAPVRFADLAPGRYRLSVRGQSFERISEEFQVRDGQRVTVRIDVNAAEARQRAKETAEKIAEGTLTVLTVTGVVILVTAAVAALVVVEASSSDD